ncbi:hypothetical protein JCGZ_09132 [Jatropha curcas]|uniref:BHLH domain-containing protein n=1 Tax=Jatropha curcas TaxID=180498 RepID=A0A067KSN3_JATCU|nr:transcription factor bHLH52 [Jatropha curcas]KDP34844.1 hypothetical protein JCGZ_09132 [Jatropha curcas]
MTLSFYSEFGSFYPQTQQEIATEHQLFACYDSNFTFSDNSSISSLYEFDDHNNELLYSSDSYTNLLPYFSSPSDSVISLSPDIVPLQDFQDSYHLSHYQKRQFEESYHQLYYPKRQKSLDQCHSTVSPSFFDGYVSNPDLAVVLPEFSPEIPVASLELPKFEAPASATFNVGRSDTDESNVKKPSVSAQSIAARERRRKITQKTQELGKLIPAGNKMNTAEMLQSAFKYVKFLQAQVKVLQHMESIQKERKEDLQTHDQLQILLTSSTIQEKLCSQEKCLVPREVLETIANDQELIQSTPSIIDEIDQLLMGTNG